VGKDFFPVVLVYEDVKSAEEGEGRGEERGYEGKEAPWRRAVLTLG